MTVLNTRSVKTGIYQPSDWGAATNGWKARRAAAGSSLVTVVGWGASILQGFYSSSSATASWFGALITALQTPYGDGGSGYYSTFQTTGVVAGSAGQITVSGAGGTVGGWDALGAGMNAFGLYPHVASSGVTLTATNVRGTTVKIVYYPSVGTSNFTYSIDGGGAVSVNSQGSATTLQTVTVSGLAAGNHTVAITATTGQPIIQAIGGFNATGIIGHNFGAAGRTTSAVTASTSLSTSGWTSTGGVTIQQQAPDLFILGGDMGINDVGASLTEIAHEANLAYACDFAKLGNPNCDIVIVAPHRGNAGDNNELFPQYVKGMRAIAETYGALFVDLWPIYRNSYSVAAAVNYWGTTSSNSGAPGSDPVHPGNTGHGLIESLIFPLLTT